MLLMQGTRPSQHLLSSAVGMGRREQLFGGVSLIRFLIKSSDTGPPKKHILIPANVQMLLEQDVNQALGKCLQNAFGRTQQVMLVGSFGSGILPVNLSVILSV